MFKITNILFEDKREKKFAAGIIFFSKETKKFLLLQRSFKLPQGGTWSSVGGKLEKNEDAKEAAKREAEEEIGFKGQVNLKMLYIFKKSFFNKKTNRETYFKYYTYIGIVNKQFQPNFNSTHGWENIDYRWLTLDELLALPNKHPGLIQALNNIKGKLEKIIST
jgi:8-oxo-dGTP pyrophosphatase MutT (NUDIX family)